MLWTSAIGSPGLPYILHSRLTHFVVGTPSCKLDVSCIDFTHSRHVKQSNSRLQPEQRLHRLVSSGIEGTFDPTDSRPTEELPALREGVEALTEASPLLPDDGETQKTFLSESMPADLGVDTEFCLCGMFGRVGEGFNNAAIPARESPPVSMLLRRFLLGDGQIFSSDVDSGYPTFAGALGGPLTEGVLLLTMASP